MPSVVDALPRQELFRLMAIRETIGFNDNAMPFAVLTNLVYSGLGGKNTKPIQWLGQYDATMHRAVADSDDDDLGKLFAAAH